MKKHMDHVQMLTGVTDFNPQCDQNGHFYPKQCIMETRECWCVHPFTGDRRSDKFLGNQNTFYSLFLTVSHVSKSLATFDTSFLTDL